MVIYKITNKSNGKIYIGQTVRKLDKRIHEHKNAIKYNRKSAISNAINKYGIENFSIETLDIAKNYEELNKKEIFYINKYNSAYPHGYNLRKGGDNTGFTEFTINKLKASQKKLNKKRGRSKHPRSKKVVNIESGEIYNSAKDVSEINNISYSTLKAKLQGVNGNETPFRYLENTDKYKKYTGQGKKQGKSVICLKSNQKWKNAKQCAEEIGVPPTTLRHALVYKGFYESFVYEENLRKTIEC